MTIPTTGTQARHTQVVRIWRQNRCLRSSTIGLYLRWVRRFQAYCRAQDLEESAQLTVAGVDTFATWYAKRQGIDRTRAFEGARSALRAWALAFLRSRQRSMVELDLADIDAFIVTSRHHYARRTVADMVSSLRGFLRFLHATERLREVALALPA